MELIEIEQVLHLTPCIAQSPGAAEKTDWFSAEG